MASPIQLPAQARGNPPSWAGKAFRGGVVSYATEVKQKVLGVSPETVERHGVVSAECAAEMPRPLNTCPTLPTPWIETRSPRRSS